MTDRKKARQINYLNLGFDEFVRDLKNYRKTFFPDVSKEVNPASSEMMMLEESAFIGDVLGLYLEDRFRNSNLVTATDIDSIYNIARFLGRNPEGPRAARGTTNFYLEVPATTGSTNEKIPDMRYAINFKSVQLQNDSGIMFEALEDVDFSDVNPSSSLNVRVSQVDANNSPTHFILKKEGEVIAGQTKTQETTVGEFQRFKEIEISEPNVLDIISVTDSEGNEWFEVDFLARESIFVSTVNTDSDSEDVPYILKLKTAPRRFVKKTNPRTGKTTLVFGTGKATEVGDDFVPDPTDVSLDLKGKLSFAPQFIDPQNFLNTKTLGLSPQNTTLTIKARVGGGKATNTSQNSLAEIVSKVSDFSSEGLNTTDLNNTLQSFSTNNNKPISGGDEPEQPEEIKQNTSAFFAAQGRLNTREDYISRTLSLPSKFGKVFRVYAETNCVEQGGVQLHVIAKNNNDQLINPTDNLKKNLKRYLSKFVRLGQGIDILNGKIINIGLDYTIVVAPGENKTETKLNTLIKVKDFFNVNKWSLNQPIVIDDIRCLIAETKNVVSIPELTFSNKSNTINGRSYSSEVFSIDVNTINNIIFPPSNSIFEVKFPNVDIKVAAL